MREPRALVFSGTLPPPVNGMTIVTREILDRLEKHWVIRRFDWSAGGRVTGTVWKLLKSLRVSQRAIQLALARKRPGTVLYTVAQSRGGLWYDLLTVAVARVRRYRCVLHHHTSMYLDRTDPRMALITRVMGPDSLHVTLCPRMSDAFRSRYPRAGAVVELPNSFILLGSDGMPPASPSGFPDGPLTLGHISNLTVVKGVDLAIDTFAGLVEGGHDVRLVIAGPFRSRAERHLVDEAQSRFGDRLDYRGAVYGDAKAAFYQDIDVMVFPTRSLREAQPLVLLESMSYGRPVITYGRACIPDLVGAGGGLVIDPDRAFVEPATRALEEWLCDPGAYEEAARAARRRAEQLRREAGTALDAFMGAMGGLPSKSRERTSSDRASRP